MEVSKLQNEFVLSKSEFAELKEYIDSVKKFTRCDSCRYCKKHKVFGYLPIEVQQFISDETTYL